MTHPAPRTPATPRTRGRHRGEPDTGGLAAFVSCLTRYLWTRR